jgi:hypothetical protein
MLDKIRFQAFYQMFFVLFALLEENSKINDNICFAFSSYNYIITSQKLIMLWKKKISIADN